MERGPGVPTYTRGGEWSGRRLVTERLAFLSEAEARGMPGPHRATATGPAPAGTGSRSARLDSDELDQFTHHLFLKGLASGRTEVHKSDMGIFAPGRDARPCQHQKRDSAGSWLG